MLYKIVIYELCKIHGLSIDHEIVLGLRLWLFEDSVAI